MKAHSVYLIIAFLFISLCVFIYQSQPSQTLNWCVIQDINSDRLRIEVANNETWQQLLNMKDLGLRKWIGGKLIEANNEWGFTFDPTTIRVADITAEGLQTNLRFIKQDPDYWFAMRTCYVSAIVIEVSP